MLEIVSAQMTSRPHSLQYVRFSPGCSGGSVMRICITFSMARSPESDQQARARLVNPIVTLYSFYGCMNTKVRVDETEVPRKQRSGNPSGVLEHFVMQTGGLASELVRQKSPAGVSACHDPSTLIHEQSGRWRTSTVGNCRRSHFGPPERLHPLLSVQEPEGSGTPARVFFSLGIASLERTW